MRSFYIDKARSESAAEEPFFLAAYKIAFPGMLGYTNNNQKNDANTRGIDRFINLNNGNTIRVDEKRRFKSYPDFALEFEHVESGGATTPGWINKNLVCDFIGYAVIPESRLYVLPWLTLRRTWNTNNAEWLRRAKQRQDGFKIADSQNTSPFGRDYISRNLCVPRAVLLDAMRDAQIIDVPPAAAAAA